MKPLFRSTVCAGALVAASVALAAEPTAPSPSAATQVPSAVAASPVAVTGAVAAMPPVSLPPRRARPLSPAARSVVTANRAATQEPGAQGYVNATQIFAFSEGALFHIYTAPGQVTDVALQPGETLVSVAAGDTVRWVIGDTTSGAGEGKRTHILVKPFASGLATNAVVTTDRRVYHLSLTSTVRTAMAAVSWAYPQDQLLALKKAADAAVSAAPVADDVAVDRLRFDYVVSGDSPRWRPLCAFDDGQRTFIEFPADIATGIAPPLFVVGQQGAAELVNYRVRGRFYIVDRLFDTAELRYGLKRQEIVRISHGTSERRRRAS